MKKYVFPVFQEILNVLKLINLIIKINLRKFYILPDLGLELTTTRHWSAHLSTVPLHPT